ncbi:MAG: NUDIX domain-containing protein [Patescibacteria group bacterium]
MELKGFRRAYTKGLKKTTLGIIRKSSGEICLAMKKRGFGTGKWNFSGGKVLPDETPEQCLVRETEEEFGTKISNLRPVGILYFYFSDVPVEKN